MYMIKIQKSKLQKIIDDRRQTTDDRLQTTDDRYTCVPILTVVS